jgi:hypothetical protein
LTCVRSYRPSRSGAEVGTDTTAADPERPTRHRAHAERGGRTVGGNNSRTMSTAIAPRHDGLGRPPLAAAHGPTAWPVATRTARQRGDRAWLANQPRQSTRTIIKVLATTKRVVKRPNDLHQHQEGTLGYRPEPKHAATYELDFTERTRQHGLAKLSNDLKNALSLGLIYVASSLFELLEKLASDRIT